jgi:hypothetical protein
MTPEEQKRQLVETIGKWDMAKPAPRYGTLVRSAIQIAEQEGEDRRGRFLAELSRHIHVAVDEIEEWAYTKREPLPATQAKTLDFIRRWYASP